MSVNLILNLSHLASNLATRGTAVHPEKSCVSLKTDKPVNYEFQAQQCESLIYEHVFHTALGDKLAIWCSWRPARRRSAVFWQFLPWDYLLIPLDFLAFLQIYIHEIAISIVHQLSLLSQPRIVHFSSFGTGKSNVRLSIVCVPIPVFWDDPPPREDENWTTHPPPRAQKLMTH